MKTVVGLFPSVNEAQGAKQRLIADGYSAQDITVMANEQAGALRAGAGAGLAGSEYRTDENEGIGHKIANFFRSITGGEEEGQYYSDTVSRGGAFLALSVADGNAETAAGLLESLGAKDVEEEGGYANTERGIQSHAGNAQTNAAAIPVVEEQLQVGKRQVQRGGVRVYSHMTETPVEENVRLREEHIHVERRPVDRPATEADFTTGRDRRIELTETAEEAVVSKSSRVVEEVVVGKDATERNQTVRDTVRKTEVEVERIPGTAAGTAAARMGAPRTFSDYDADFRKDFQNNYGTRGGSYDRYQPAYQYGYTLANDSRYAGRDWADVETDAKRNWSNTGTGTWDEFKNAVQSGWDKVRGR